VGGFLYLVAEPEFSVAWLHISLPAIQVLEWSIENRPPLLRCGFAPHPPERKKEPIVGPTELSTRGDNSMPTIQTASVVQEALCKTQVRGEPLEEPLALSGNSTFSQEMCADQPSDFVIGGQSLVFDGLLCAQLSFSKDRH
jgi:hypothetical protein